MIDYKRQVLVVHPPKTAGQAVQMALTGSRRFVDHRGVYRHDTYAQMLRRVPEARSWPAYILIRDPLNRLVSFFLYTKYHTRYRKQDILGNLLKTMTLQEFIDSFDYQAWFDREVNPAYARLMPMSHYGRGEDDSYAENLVPLRHENIAETIHRLFNLELPEVNITNHSERLRWRWSTQQRVRTAFAEDFDRYGYEIPYIA